MNSSNELIQNSTLDRISSSIPPSELFARRVWGFSKRSGAHLLYPGKHYTSIARLLISPFQSLGDETSLPENESPENFITLYDLNTNRSNSHVVLRTEQDLEQYDATLRQKTTGRILFLRGYPSAQWLCHVGSVFNIDPEFYFRHLDFSPMQDFQEHFTMGSLPSSADIFRLRITTILSCNNLSASSLGTTTELRAGCNRYMADYIEDLISGRSMSVSTSIVRRFNVHDRQHFSVEQMISICVVLSPKGWTVIAWLDTATDLGELRCGPWTHLQRGCKGRDNLTAMPIIQYRERNAQKREPLSRTTEDDLTLHTSTPLAQSATYLPSRYGRSLQPKIMECDAFYSMHELFRLSIASESQFLELMNVKIKQACNTESGGSIKDLRITLDLVQDHHQLIEENLTNIRGRGNPNWPKAKDEEHVQGAEAAARQLETDCVHLSAYATMLEDKCKDGIAILMNNAIYQQSETATAQMRETIKLTLLAFFFVPLTFTTSVFSMQVVEIAQREIHIWTWVFVSALLVISSFLFWRYNLLDTMNAAWMAANVRLSRLSRRTRM